MNRSGSEPVADVDWASAYAYLEEQQEAILRRLADRLGRLETEVEELTRARIRAVSLEVEEERTLHSVIEADGSDLSFAFYVYREDDLRWRQPYGRSNTLRLSPEEPGRYRVRGFVRRGTESSPADTRVSTTVTLATEGT
ncbi:hypothetical protein [Cellulomonas fimi]|uniref:Uncharacterized protein n=1 Tax=Cellulomonas fimi TaxID=1708 RepID=A0A7Y0QI43_CELFI|nr:hypothetical protein [Cellulomonas fimi]NMR20534.1 hypothetical protein [Cellulomonas fimi]